MSVSQSVIQSVIPLVSYLISPSITRSINFSLSLRNVAMGTSTAVARISAFISVYAPLLVSNFLIISKFKSLI